MSSPYCNTEKIPSNILSESFVHLVYSCQFQKEIHQAQNDTTAACRQGKVEQVNIKNKCGQ